MLLDDLADYLTSQGGAGVGTPYKGYLPEQDDVAVAIYETGGMAPIRAMQGSAGVVAVERPSVQVVARATELDYQSARTRIANVYALLEGLPERTINGTRYLYAAAAQSPFPMRRDEQGRVYVAVNFDLWKALSTSTST